MFTFGKNWWSFYNLKRFKSKEELNEAKHGIDKLGGKVMKETHFTLTNENDHRCNIFIHKIKKHPKSILDHLEK